MTRKCHVGFGEKGACFLPEAIQERRRAFTLLRKGVNVGNWEQALCAHDSAVQHSMAKRAQNQEVVGNKPKGYS